MGDASAENTSLEDPADAVEALWSRSGEAPDLIAFLADHPYWSPSELRAALLIDQQFRSQTPQPWGAEEYVALVPPLVADDDFTLDLISGEFRGRSRQGQPPSLWELSGRFPHLHQQLQRQLEIAWFEDASNKELEPDDDDSDSETDPGGARFGDYELCEEIARGEWA